MPDRNVGPTNGWEQKSIDYLKSASAGFMPALYPL